MTTYTETVYRYRIVRHEELPESHKAAHRLNGVNPDDIWSLVWSFETLEDAESALADEEEYAAPWQTHKIIDGGATETVERKSWI